MKTGKAFLAGVVGGAVMSAIMFMARTVMGMDVKLELLLGTMVGLQPGTTAWIVGFVMHLMISGLIALAYAWAFENVLHRANAGAGVMVSVVHIVVAGVFMGLMPMMHPLVPEQMEGPGFFMLGLGVMGLVAFVMLHVIFGAIVGAMYGPALHGSAVGEGARARPAL
ncbi:hypothetical protein RQM47_17100 [Rubrivirga sp. S365]|uniref:hypothetical protein n=1 Tax=Rubrivirga sp. S365 TaxID=3076080 RepID=UPI0028C87CB1|nr:hypothetical protein [Rubrivirga sp. S365]MDT7858370.1 hypothetical protein [Rubrivirga sp. S365]